MVSECSYSFLIFEATTLFLSLCGGWRWEESRTNDPCVKPAIVGAIYVPIYIRRASEI